MDDKIDEMLDLLRSQNKMIKDIHDYVKEVTSEKYIGESRMTSFSINLAAREVGWNNVFQCEIDPFCQSVLKYYFPKTVLYEDIKRTDFTSWKGKIDVLTGGFPC